MWVLGFEETPTMQARFSDFEYVAKKEATRRGNPFARLGLWEVELSPMEEVLHEEVPF